MCCPSLAPNSARRGHGDNGMGVVTRKDSPYYWLNLERPGLPPLRESTKLLARGLPDPQLAENRRLAQQIYQTRMGDMARSRHGIPVTTERATFATFAAWYLKHVTPEKRTAAREASAIKRLVSVLGRRPLDSISHETAVEYRTVRRKSVKAATVNREVDVLKSMLTAAVPRYLPANPLAGLKRLRARSAPPRLLTREEEARLLAVVPPADAALLICALDTCLRLTDVVNLRRDQDRKTTLVIPDPKAEPYKVPVSSRLRAALDALPKSKSGYYFAQHHQGEGARASQNSAIRMFQLACKAAKVPHGRPSGVTFHCLRHTAATRALDAGATLRELMELGGWRDLKSVLRYTRATAADQALVDRMAGGHARPMHAESDEHAE
jgi:integrase